jgi:membrane-bound metal-dependent hydrolase YbcI (DUF457 family)
MHLESHVACGWLLANLWPGATKRQRFLITLSAAISDADGLTYLVSGDLYAHWHHTVGHNIFAAIAMTTAALLLTRGRQWLPMLLLTQIGFWSHMIGDYFFSGWGVAIFWPLSHNEVMYRPRIGLDHPINIALCYAAYIYCAASIWIHRRTILEFFWPSMDALLIRMFGRRTATCHICSRRTGVLCDTCGKPVCLRHAQITTSLTIRCTACRNTPSEVGYRCTQRT